MPEGWSPLFEADIEGRPVLLKVYEPDGYLRVETVQAETEVTEGYVDESSVVFPMVISKGSKIEIDAATPDELEKELVQAGFALSSAREIVRHAWRPGT